MLFEVPLARERLVAVGNPASERALSGVHSFVNHKVALARVDLSATSVIAKMPPPRIDIGEFAA